MMVAFPTPEPWPAETFAEYGIADLEALIEGARAAIDERRSAALADESRCADCGEIVHRSETTCAGCGSHLNPKANERPGSQSLGRDSANRAEEVTLPMTDESDRPAGARSALASYEPSTEEAHVLAAHDTLEAALARPVNVTPLRQWSVKAS